MNMMNLERERNYFLARCLYHEHSLRAAPAYSTSETLPHTQMILQRLCHESELTIADMVHIENAQELIPVAEKERTDCLVRNQRFKDWVVAPKSTELLIHGDFEATYDVSALSLFSSLFLQGVREYGQFTTLAFYCSRHLEGEHAGGRAMIKSLVTQLLRQCQFDAGRVDKQVKANLIEDGDIQQMTVLFRSLLLQLHGITVICVIDGVKYYERDEHVDDMALVLRSLLDLTLDQSLEIVFKVLVTSHSPTHIVRQAFAPTDILSLDPLAGVGQGCSTTRFVRDLNHSLQGLDG